MLRRFAWSVLFTISFVLAGCGGSGTADLAGQKDGTPSNLNADGPKDAGSSVVTGSPLNLSDSRSSSEYCQGQPPFLGTAPQQIVVAPIPSTLNPLTDEEIQNGPGFSMPEFGHVADRVQAEYPQLETESELGKRVIFETLKLSTERSVVSNRSRSPLEGLNSAERRVVFRYPYQAWKCRYVREETARILRAVFPNEDIEKDNVRLNAFKHAFWNILMCSRGTPEFAEAMADAHEVPADPEGSPAGKSESMDLHNNRIGRLVYNRSTHFRGDETALLAALFAHLQQFPYQYFDGRPNPQTNALVFWEPVPVQPAPDDIHVSESQFSSSASHVGFFRGGTQRYWRESTSHGIGSHMYWTYSNGNTRDNFGVWRPAIPQTRTYAVYAFIPDNFASTKKATYEVQHANGVTLASIRQWDIFNGWAYLGTFQFNEGTSGYVLLGDNTGEPVMQRWIGFDSLKWVSQ